MSHRGVRRGERRGYWHGTFRGVRRGERRGGRHGDAFPMAKAKMPWFTVVTRGVRRGSPFGSPRYTTAKWTIMYIIARTGMEPT